MDLLSTVGQGFGEMISAGVMIFARGGWVVVSALIFYMLFRVYRDTIQGYFVDSQKRVYFHVKIEKENLQSTLAVEQIFSSLHAIQTNFTWADMNLEGMVNLWVSFEIVSLGGKISYIVSAPEKYAQLLHASIYAQYPNAEISEVEDYMKNLSHYKDHGPWQMWGTEWVMTHDYAYPIRTYREFEHPSAEEPIIDPLTALFEALTKAEAHELMAVQIVIKPLADKEWMPHCKEVVKELKEEIVHKHSFAELLFPPLRWMHEKTFIQVVSDSRKPSAHGHEDESKQPKVMRMTEGERNIIKGIETKMTKPGWATKMRHLYIAPREQFDGTKKQLLIGAFRPFSLGSNNLKPDVNVTWTNYQYAIFKHLEDPFVQFEIIEKKHRFLMGFVKRSMKIGADPMIMNIEELATIYHFPLATASTAPVERIDIKKGQPPADLPIAM